MSNGNDSNKDRNQDSENGIVKNDKVKISKALKVHFEGFKILFKYSPKVFIALILHSIFTSIAPFIAIYYSAQFINELANKRRVNELISLILTILIVTLLVGVISSILSKYLEYQERISGVTQEKIYLDKYLKMDFKNIDDQDLFNKAQKAAAIRYINVLGLVKILDFMKKFLSSTFTMITSIYLAFGLFTLKVPNNDKGLLFLNNKSINILFIAVIFLLVLASTKLEIIHTNLFNKLVSTFDTGNKFFGFFFWNMNEEKRALDIRTYNQYKSLAHPYIKKNNPYGEGSMFKKYYTSTDNVYPILSKMCIVLISCLTLLYVSLKAYAGAFPIGNVGMYLATVTTFFSSAITLMNIYGEMLNNTKYIEDTLDILNVKNTMYVGGLTTEKRNDRKYEVEFRNVSFKYPHSDNYALKNLNIKFKVGSRLAVVGMNGSGKTTFIKLLCRLYDPTEGTILLNGIDIRKYKYDEYIDIFAPVFQDFKLLALPLGQNISSKYNYEKERVMMSIEKSGLLDRFKTLDKGLETYLYKDLDKEGVMVSGGEAQKIAIARALYKNAPFIILDEPTAALDPIAEAEIYDKFNEIAEDKTTIYISHRLSSCKFCDDIAVFHEGKVIQFGNHENLLKDKEGKYFELWNSQAQYYK